MTIHSTELIDEQFDALMDEITKDTIAAPLPSTARCIKHAKGVVRNGTSISQLKALEDCGTTNVHPRLSAS